MCGIDGRPGGVGEAECSGPSAVAQWGSGGAGAGVEGVAVGGHEYGCGGRGGIREVRRDDPVGGAVGVDYDQIVPHHHMDVGYRQKLAELKGLHPYD